MRTLRVVQIVPSLAPGGAERMVVHLATELARRGHHTSVISLFDRLGTDLEEALEMARVPVIYLGKKRGFNPWILAQLTSAVKKLNPDVVHTHQYILGYALPLTILVRHAVKVHTIHTLAHYEIGGVGKLAYKVAFLLGTTPVAVSQEVRESVMHSYPGTKPVVIPNGVPVERYCHHPAGLDHLRHRLGINSDEVVVVCVANLTRAKNHSLLLRAFAQAVKAAPTLRLLLVGDGPRRAELERQCSELAIIGRVKFLGFCRDVPSVLRASDLFALTSDWEGSPLAILEAMAAGLPVVATAVGGVPEVVQHGVTGLLVSQGDEVGITRALVTLAGNQSLRLGMGQAGQRRAQRLFSAHAMAAAYEHLYWTLLGQLGAPQGEGQTSGR